MGIQELLTKIRLKEYEINAITSCFDKLFLPGDHIWIFGSRADISKRGGDIDLYIETSKDAAEAYKAKIAFIIAICDQIGDQKIDVVLNLKNDKLDLPIYEIAKKTGVKIK